ncbi:MAG: site-specific DNA-methyltransferase [Burkholderiales bacterium]
MTEKTNEPEKLDLRSHNIAEDKGQELLRLFPEIRTEGNKLDFERLKLALGEAVDAGKERYGMNWPGKAECFRTIQAPSLGTLRPCPEESVNFDTTENLIIEGDNLEVLKLLQKSYLGKVKMIYIDPPYNTGNDFIYPDNYTESLQTYLEYTGQVDAEGRKFGTNTEAEGRFHTKWLNMMYPRLYLARNLLREDGIVFVSINDAELANLRRLMDDVFGEENFIGTLVWKSRHNVDSRNKTALSSDHEYVVVYGLKLTGQEIDKNKYSNPDNDPRGPWMSDNMVGLATKDQRPNLHYDLANPQTGLVYSCPEKGWRYDRSTMAKKIAEGRVLWPANADGRPRHKKFLAEVRSEFTGFSSILDVPTTAEGTQEVRELFGEAVFDFPKPVGVIAELVRQGTSEESADLVLDFFAGSGTTAHAILDVNKRGRSNRKFILVQLPEPIGRDQYPTIADITKDRVRRVINKLNGENAATLRLDGSKKLDLGFRVFKLAESNFKTWNAEAPKDADGLAKQLELHVDHIRESRTQDDLLYEILLKSGFPLTTPVETFQLAGKTLHSVSSGALLVCLERELTIEMVRGMAEMKPERVVCLDESFAGNDQLKANAVQIFKNKGVTSFKTV